MGIVAVSAAHTAAPIAAPRSAADPEVAVRVGARPRCSCVSFVGARRCCGRSRGWSSTSLAPAAARARARCSAAARWRSSAARSASRCSSSCSWPATSGPVTALDNFAPTFIMITSGSGSCSLSILFGDVFRAFNPWRAIGRATGALVGRRAPARRPYPERLGRWPAAVGLLVFTWIELGRRAGPTRRRRSSPPSLGYTVVTLAAQAVWGVETWTRRGEAFSVYFNLFSRISVFETRDARRRPAPAARRPAAARPGARHGRVRDRDDRHRHVRRAQPGRPVEDHRPSAAGRASPRSASASTARSKLADTIGLLGGVLLVAGFYRLGIEGARSVGGELTRGAAADEPSRTRSCRSPPSTCSPTT